MAPVAHAGPLTFGKTSVGRTSEVFSADHKRANEYALPIAGAISQLNVYLEPTLLQTKVSIEVDWQNGGPVATSGRTGMGYVE